MPLNPSGLGGSLMQVSASTTQTHPLAYCVHRCDTRHITSTYTHIALLGTFPTKRETSKNFPRPREPVISIIMTLGNLFSAQDIAALKSVATAQTDAEKYTTHISEKAWDMLYETAANLGQKLTPKWWCELDQIVSTDSEVVVCMRGKRECEIISVTYQAYWARHLGQMLKSGYSIVWIGKSFSTQVNWDNWKRIYAKLTAKPETQQYDPEMTSAEKREMREARRLKKQFNDGADVIRRRKSMVPTTNEEAANQAYSVARDREFRAAAERDMAISGTVALANKIFAMV